MVLQVLCDGVEVGSHFTWAFDRFQSLVSKSGGTTVPKELFLPCHVMKGHGIAEAYTSIQTSADMFWLCKGMVFQVTGCTTDFIATGEVRIMEKAFAELDTFFGQRKIFWQCRDRETFFDFERVGCADTSLLLIGWILYGGKFSFLFPVYILV